MIAIATRAEQISRHDRAKQARERLKSGSYDKKQEAAPSRSQAIESYDASKPKEMFGPPKPETTPFSAPLDTNPLTRIENNRQLFAPKTAAPGMIQTPQLSYPSTVQIEPALPGRSLPVVGPVLRGLDVVQKFTEPAAKIAQELYTPGAGLGNVGAFSGALESGLARLAPELALGKGIGAKFATGVIREGVTGAPLAAGQSLAAHPEKGLSEAAKQGVYGAATGAKFGALGAVAGPLIGKGFSAIRTKLDDAARSLTETNPVYKAMVQEVGEKGVRADVGKRQLADIDEQIANIGQRKETNPTMQQNVSDQLQSLKNERQNMIAYIQQHEPDFKAPESNVTVQVDQPILTPRTPSAAAEQPVAKPVAQSIPVRKASTSAAPPIERGIRANYANQLKNGNFSDELNQGIRTTDQTYEIARNKASVAKANENVKNLTKAEADFMTNESGGPDHIATGYRLIQELDALGEHQRALNVVNKLAKDLTKSGQTSQAGSLLSRLSPEGQLLNLVRTAERNGKQVTVAHKVEYQALAGEVRDNLGAGIRENQFTSILNRLERGENVSMDDIKKLGNFLDRGNKVINPKKVPEVPITDELPKEFKDVKKRDKIVSFLDDAEQAALARIQARKTRLNALPFDEWGDHAIIVASQIGKGAIKAATHVEDMVRLFGEEIRPVASQVYKKAQDIVKGVSRSAAEGKLEAANNAFRRLTGQAQAEKAIVEETANHVRKLIADAKKGDINPDDIQKLRDYSDEIAQFAKPSRVPTAEQKFMQSVKALSKKIAQVETQKIPPDQANREVSSLLRQVTKLTEEGKPTLEKQAIDNKALSDIAHDVMAKTRPNPKPTTMQEKLVEKYIRENPVSEDDIKKLRVLAKDITTLSGEKALNADMAMQKILNSYEKSSLWDKINAIRYIAMLFNTGTQAVNAVSGPIMATTGYVADVFGTMIDIAMSKALNQPRSTTLYGTNPLQFMARWFKNAKVGAKAGAEGVNPSGIAGANDIRGLTYKSLKNPLGLLERGLGAVSKGADYGTYKSVHQAEMQKIAFLDAKNKGIKGKRNIQQHIEQFVNNPPPEAILQANRIGEDTTFQRKDSVGGKLANYANSAPELIKPVVGSIFPYIRTPINMASMAVTLTPGGIIKGLYQLTSKSDASRREAIRTLSLGLTGSGMTALAYYLSQVGIITGSNDSGDKNVDAIREQAGQGKYRFNTSALSRYLTAMIEGKGSEAAAKAAQYREGDKQFDYNKLQPLAFPLAIGAGLEGNKEKGTLGALKGAGIDAYGSLYGMSTLKGLQDMFQPQYGGTVGEKALGPAQRLAESFLKSFSPSLLGQEARRQDPIQRQTRYNNGIQEDVTSYFKSRFPGLSQSLPPKKTTLGQNNLNAPGATGQYLNPYNSNVAAYNKAAVIISKLIDSTGDTGLAPSAPAKSVRGKDRSGQDVTVKIPPDRYAKLQEEVGQEITKRILDIPQDWDDDKKAERVRKIYDMVNTKYRNIVKRELGIRVR